jgi:ketosteroid isomerase-like protein
MDDDREQIKAIYAAITALLADGDIGGLSMYYTTDAIQFPPDRAPLMGWAEIRASLEKELEGISFNSTIDLLETVIVGDCAYAWGQFRATGGQRSQTSGSFLDIFRRQPDGSWKISRSAWSNHELGE